MVSNIKPSYIVNLKMVEFSFICVKRLEQIVPCSYPLLTDELVQEAVP